VNLNDKAILLRNDGGNRNNWLQVRPMLAGGEIDAIGARITVATGSVRQIRDAVAVMGYLSQGDPRAHFGLAEASKADWVEVRWPDGSVQRMENVPANQVLTVVKK